MKLLLDECVTRRLKRDLAGHETKTVAEAGFRGLKNGALLRAASADFDVLITVDRNLPFQQNVAKLEIAVVILISQGTTYPSLKPLIPALLASLDSTKPGEVLKVEWTTKDVAKRPKPPPAV